MSLHQYFKRENIAIESVKTSNTISGKNENNNNNNNFQRSAVIQSQGTEGSFGNLLMPNNLSGRASLVVKRDGREFSIYLDLFQNLNNLF